MSNLELNKGDNFIFGVDVSLSMKQGDCPGGMSRIEYLKENVISFCREASKYDEDGIDVLTFGQKITTYEGVTADKAADVIAKLQATEAMTDTAGAIKKAWELHQAFRKRGGTDQSVAFFATDGAPSDQNAVIAAIREIAKQQDADNEEFSISFLTVGEPDEGLRSFLTMVDDDLKAVDKNGKPIDMVDVKALADVDFLSAFVGAVHD